MVEITNPGRCISARYLVTKVTKGPSSHFFMGPNEGVEPFPPTIVRIPGNNILGRDSGIPSLSGNKGEGSSRILETEDIDKGTRTEEKYGRLIWWL